MSKLTIKIENFKALRSNTLFGFAVIVIPQMHLRIIDATVHESHGKRWVELPAKPQITRDGAVRRDERQKTLYVPVIEFMDKPMRDAFSQRAIEALLAAYPDAFDGGAAP